jgi:hypothetical protein
MMVYKLGRYYFHRINLVPGSKHITPCETNEQQYPYRIGKSFAIRFFGEYGWVVGKWVGCHDDEDSALMAGLDAHEEEVLDEDGGLAERFHRQAARRTVAASSKDLDEEWTVVNALDLMDGQ